MNRWLLSAIILLTGASVFLFACILTLTVFINEISNLGALPFLLGMMLGILPVPLYVAVVLWTDRLDSEPWWALAVTFLWGALVATAFSYHGNTVMGTNIYTLTGSYHMADFLGAVVSAPLWEETTKGFIIFIFFLIRPRGFDSPLHGIMYACMSGLGFAMTENFLYYARQASSGGAEGAFSLFVLRGILFSSAHPLFTSFTGLGFAFAGMSKSPWKKVIYPIVGFALALLSHGLWNGLASVGGVLAVPTLFGMIICGLLYFALIVVYSWLREIRILQKHLLEEVVHGHLTRMEYDLLSSSLMRMAQTFEVLLSVNPGRVLSLIRMRNHAAALAVHRDRVDREVVMMSESQAKQQDLSLWRSMMDERKKFIDI